jgi:RNA polymerase sigma-70 factor (ECF subfamily)
MDDLELADTFDHQRPQLRAVAYRILGSLTEADDAVQEAWLRLRRTDAEQIDSLERWLTTVVARICLNMLRSRRTRGERPLDSLRPEPIIDDPAVGTDPEHEALLADSVGIALQVVLDTLSPAERLAFVLHDMFAVPFDEIAAMVERSPEATRQLASRARRRVRETAPPPDPDLTRQRTVVDAYFAAARDGDLEALVAVLDPDVVPRAHRRDGDPLELRGSGAGRAWGDGGPAFRSVRSPGPGQRCRRGCRVRGRAAVRGTGVHGRRRARGGDRRVQRPRAGRQTRHPRDHSLNGTPNRQWARRCPRRVEAMRAASATSTRGTTKAGLDSRAPRVSQHAKLRRRGRPFCLGEW